MNIGFLPTDRAVFYRNAAFSILVLSTNKRYPSFLKRACVFQKICFNVKVMKTLNISSDFLIKYLSNGELL